MVDGTANVVARLLSAGAMYPRKLVQVMVAFRNTVTVRSSLNPPFTVSCTLVL